MSHDDYGVAPIQLSLHYLAWLREMQRVQVQRLCDVRSLGIPAHLFEGRDTNYAQASVGREKR